MPIAAALPALAIAGGTLASGLIGANAAKSAAGTQAQAAMAALNQQQQIYQNNLNLVSPFVNQGKNAGSTLAGLYGLPGGDTASAADAFNKFTSLPAYQFPLQQGIRAVTNSMNAQGLGQSGAFAKGVSDFSSGLASTYMMQNYVNPLLNMYGTGAGAAGNLAGTSTQMAGTLGNTMMGIGQAGASGAVGSANAITGGINSGISNLMLYSMLAKGGAMQNPFAGMNSGAISGGTGGANLPGGTNLVMSSPTFGTGIY